MTEIKNPVMRMSDAGTNLLRDKEGLRLKAYRDPGSSNGLPITVGWGSTRHLNGAPFFENEVITKEYAERLFRNDISHAEKAVNTLVKVPLTQNEFDALVSFVYNVGETAFAKSTLLRLLNQGDYKGAAEQFDRWIYNDGKVMDGLIRRRKAEKGWFSKAPDLIQEPPAPIVESVPTIVNAGPKPTLPKYDKIELVSNVWTAVQAGNKLANATTWKNRQNAINAIVGVLVGLLAIGKVFGLELEVDNEILLSIGSLIFFGVCLFNGWATTATTGEVGLQSGSQTNGNSST